MASNQQKSTHRVGLSMVWVAVTSVVLTLGLYLGTCFLILRHSIVPLRKEHDQTLAELGFREAKPLSFKSADDEWSYGVG